MKQIRPFSTALILGLLAGAACAQVAADPAAHSHDHSASAAAQGGPSKVQPQMKMMQEMHQKMQATKTPEERAALMKDHMRVMHDGMAAMAAMKQGLLKEDDQQDMLVQRMDMLELMMQMMMDREAGKAQPAR